MFKFCRMIVVLLFICGLLGCRDPYREAREDYRPHRVEFVYTYDETASTVVLWVRSKDCIGCRFGADAEKHQVWINHINGRRQQLKTELVVDNYPHPIVKYSYGDLSSYIQFTPPWAETGAKMAKK